MMVVLSHLASVSRELDITCPAIRIIPLGLSYLGFRMPAFFILAGFWGRYEVCFKDFLLRNIKGLFLPLILFSYFGEIIHEIIYELLKGTYNAGALEWPFVNILMNYWFIWALFIAKCVYYGLYRICKNRKVILLVCLVLYFIGVSSLNIGFLPNFVYWKQGLIMLIYLPVGQIVKEVINNKIVFFGSVAVFIVGILILKINGIIFPSPSGNMANLNLNSAIPSLLLCISGSVTFLKLCSFINRCRIIEIIGRNTLAIYIMHVWIVTLSLKVLRTLLSGGMWLSTAATLFVFAAAIIFPCLISWMFNRPKLKWLLGK